MNDSEPIPDNDRFYAAMAALADWRSRNPNTEAKDMPGEIAAHRAHAMERLSALQQGETDPWMGRQIQVLIRKSTRYIVYLDEDMDVQWWWLDRLTSDDGLSLVQANVTRLSGASSFLLSDSNHLGDGVLEPVGDLLHSWVFGGTYDERRKRRAQRERDRTKDAAEQIRCLIAESMAMMLNRVSRAECEKIQAMAEHQILVERDRICRGPFFWNFLLGAGCFAAFAAVATHVPFFSSLAGLAQVALAGAVGAFISAITRTQQLALAPEAGRSGLRVDAFVRACIGAGAAVLVYFAFESKIILKGALPENSTELQASLMYFLCIAAGASERILPNLIGRAESMIGGSAPKEGK